MRKAVNQELFWKKRASWSAFRPLPLANCGELNTPVRHRIFKPDTNPHHTPLSLSYSVHARPRRELLILVAKLGDLQERVHAIPLEAVQRQAAGPILGVDPAQGQAHAEAQVGRPAG